MRISIATELHNFVSILAKIIHKCLNMYVAVVMCNRTLNFCFFSWHVCVHSSSYIEVAVGRNEYKSILKTAAVMMSLKVVFKVKEFVVMRQAEFVVETHLGNRAKDIVVEKPAIHLVLVVHRQLMSLEIPLT